MRGAIVDAARPAERLRRDLSPEELAERTRGRRRERWTARNVSRRLTPVDRVKQCGWTAAREGGVIVRITGNADTGRTAGFAGLATCGSVWACPVCCERIQARRRDELAALCATASRRGCTLVLATLTMRHNRGDRLADLWADLSRAWSAVTTNGTFRRRRAAWGLVGWVKAVEVTVGPQGWHVHIHCLLVLDWHGGEEHDAAMPDEAAREFGELLWAPWAAHLSDRPGRAPVRDAFDVRVGRGAIDQIGRYLAKADYRQSFEGLAAEATLSSHKRGRNGNRTPFELLADIVERTDELARVDGSTLLVADPDDHALRASVALWEEYTAASQGRRQLEWSRASQFGPSLREWAELGEEESDEQVAEEELGGDDAVILPPESWRAVRRHAWRVLEVAERGGTDGLIVWLDSVGLDWVRAATAPPRLVKTG